MEVAVGINLKTLLVGEQELYVGGFAGAEPLSAASLVGEQLHPLDPVNIHHRMIDAAHIDLNNKL